MNAARAAAQQPGSSASRPPQLASADDDSNFGPLQWRGKPICGEFEYDEEEWGAFFAGW